MRLSIKKLIRKYNMYFFPVFAAGLIVGLSLYVLIPKAQEILSLRSDVSDKQDDLARLKRKRLLLESLDQEQMRSDLQEAQAALPQEKDVATILLSLENISGRTQQGIDSISFSPGIVSTRSAETEEGAEGADDQPIEATEEVTVRKGVSVLPVAVRTRGSTGQFRDFLTLLEKSRRVFDIESLVITYFPDNEDFLAADFSLFAFFLPPITNIGKLDTPIAELTQQEQTLLSKISEFPNVGTVNFDAGGVPGITDTIGKSNLFSP